MANMWIRNCFGILLGMLNLLTIVIGSLLIWIGTLITSEPKALFTRILPSIASQFKDDKDAQQLFENLGAIVNSKIGMSIIIVGVIIVIISVLGFVSGMCQFTGILAPYSVIMFVLLFSMITITCLFGFHKDLVRSTLKDFEFASLREYFNFQEQDTGFSKLWNLIEDNFKCCGVNNYTDYGQVHSKPDKLLYSDSCCQGLGPNCGPSPINNMAGPCEPKIWEKINYSFNQLLLSLSIICVLLALPLVLSIGIIWHSKKEKARS